MASIFPAASRLASPRLNFNVRDNPAFDIELQITAVVVPTESRKSAAIANCIRNKSNIHVGVTRKSSEISYPVSNELEDNGLICSGCGVLMQNVDPNLPGYYQKPKDRTPSASLIAATSENHEELDGNEDTSFNSRDCRREETVVEGIDPVLRAWELEMLGYNDTTCLRQKKKGSSMSEKKRLAAEAIRELRKEEAEVVICTRCYSLKHHGRVKSQKTENLIPDFDFEKLVTSVLLKRAKTAVSTVVVMVVDCIDFDGSFPKTALRSLFEGLKRDGGTRFPYLVFAFTKIDLLPRHVSFDILGNWVSQRAKEAGIHNPRGVFLVSALKGIGVGKLLSFIKELAGNEGEIWVIGAQNAGKSTLINAFAKKEGVKIRRPTEAPVPGTTLGILRIPGLLPETASMFDTPGILHSHTFPVRLTREEQKIIELRKKLVPRTYRLQSGCSIHVGGLMRLDHVEATVQSMYVTIWASSNLSFHMGNTEKANEIYRRNIGVGLQPPCSSDRVSEMGKWVPKDVRFSGSAWDVSSVDITVAGVGWFSLGIMGEATVRVWTYDGILVSVRAPILHDRAEVFETPGFSFSRKTAQAIGRQSRHGPGPKKSAEDASDSDWDEDWN